MVLFGFTESRKLSPACAVSLLALALGVTATGCGEERPGAFTAPSSSGGRANGSGGTGAGASGTGASGTGAAGTGAAGTGGTSATVDFATTVLDCAEPSGITINLARSYDVPYATEVTALCSGWVALRNELENHVAFYHPASGTAGPVIEVRTRPSNVTFDRETGSLVFLLDPTRFVDVYDIASGEVRELEAPEVLDRVLTHVPGAVLVVGQSGAIHHFDLVAEEFDPTTGSEAFADLDLLTFTNEKALGVQYFGTSTDLTVFDYDAATRTFSGLGGTPIDCEYPDVAAISPDGKHVAIECEAGDLLDLDAENAFDSLGVWSTGYGSDVVAFSESSDSVLSAGYSLTTYEVGDHDELVSDDLWDCYGEVFVDAAPDGDGFWVLCPSSVGGAVLLNL